MSDIIIDGQNKFALIWTKRFI